LDGPIEALPTFGPGEEVLQAASRHLQGV